MTDRLDHGILNTPLAKRGNIDAQIDRYKAQRVREKRAEDSETFRRVRRQKDAIKRILNLLPETRLLELARPLGKKAPQRARAALYQMAKSNLAVWEKALREELRKSGNGCCKMRPCTRPNGPCCDFTMRCAKCRAIGCDCAFEEWCGEEGA